MDLIGVMFGKMFLKDFIYRLSPSKEKRNSGKLGKFQRKFQP